MTKRVAELESEVRRADAAAKKAEARAERLAKKLNETIGQEGEDDEEEESGEEGGRRRHADGYPRRGSRMISPMSSSTPPSTSSLPAPSKMRKPRTGGRACGAGSTCPGRSRCFARGSGRRAAAEGSFGPRATGYHKKNGSEGSGAGATGRPARARCYLFISHQRAHDGADGAEGGGVRAYARPTTDPRGMIVFKFIYPSFAAAADAVESTPLRVPEEAQHGGVRACGSVVPPRSARAPRWCTRSPSSTPGTRSRKFGRGSS